MKEIASGGVLRVLVVMLTSLPVLTIGVLAHLTSDAVVVVAGGETESQGDDTGWS
jgi:hypothetical protein